MLAILVDSYTEPQPLDLSGDTIWAFYQEEAPLDLESWTVVSLDKEYTVGDVLREAELAGLDLDWKGGNFTLREAGSGQATGRRQYEPLLLDNKTSCVTVFDITVCVTSTS